MITTLVYREGKFAMANPPIEALALLRSEVGVMVWVDIDEPSDEETRHVLDTVFEFHPLAIEDCVSDSPLPKVEDYDDYLYLVMHAVDYTKTEHFTTTELDLFLGKNFLVTHHRKPLRPVQLALEKYSKPNSVPVRGPDRFAHHLLDQMVEAYKPALLELQKDLEELEQASLMNLPAKEIFPRVVAMRKEFSSLRQIVRPQRDVAAELAQGKTKLIRPVMVPYLRDLAEELAHIDAQVETWSEELLLTFRVYLNKSSHEANAGIKVLTGITALTIPVLAVGAWFGMNFKFMPELELLWSYPLALVVMLGGTYWMLRMMTKRKWL